MELGRRQMVINPYDENPLSSLFPLRRTKNHAVRGRLPKKGIVERPWPTRNSRKGNENLGDDDQQQRAEKQQPPTEMGSPRPMHNIDNIEGRSAVVATSAISRKRLRLSGLIEKGRVIRATPSPAQRRWKAVLCTPLSSSCSSISQRPVSAVANSSKRRKVSNPLVDLLRSRIECESSEATRMALIQSDMDPFTGLGEGYQTPRSVTAGDAGRSPPPMARSTGARSRMETPVSAARVRIQSPAPARTPLADRVEFMLS